MFDNLRGNLYQQVFQSFGTVAPSQVAPSWTIEIPAVAPTQEIQLNIPWDWGAIEVVPSEEVPAQEEAPADQPVVEPTGEAEWEAVVPTPEA